MNARALIASAEASGVRFRIEQGEVRMSAALPPPVELVTALRQHRDEILEILTDAAEAAAPAEHYAAPPGPGPPAPDPLAAGLVRSFHAHRTSLAKEQNHHD